MAQPSTRSLSTEEDIVVEDLYLSGSSLKFKQYGEVHTVSSLDDLPVYEKFRDGNFSSSSLREVAHAELKRLTLKLMTLNIAIQGGKDCAKHTGLFTGRYGINAGKGVLVRFNEVVQITGNLGGSDPEYPNCTLVRSKATDNLMTLSPRTNYIIHGGEQSNNAVIFRNPNLVHSMTGEDVFIDVEFGKELLVVDGKFRRAITAGITNPLNTGSRVQVLPVGSNEDTILMPVECRLTNAAVSRRVMKAVKLTLKLMQPLEVSTITRYAGVSVKEVLAILVRAKDSPVLGVGCNVCLLGYRSDKNQDHFRQAISVGYDALAYAVSPAGGSEGCSWHRTMGDVKVSCREQLYHLGAEGNALTEYSGIRAWAG